MRRLLLFSSVVLVVQAKCLFRGCNIEDFKKPCVRDDNDTAPAPLPEESRETLSTLCTELINPNEPLCCDESQVNDFMMNFIPIKSLLGACPSCFANLGRLFCHMTCSPEQSTFLNITSVGPIIVDDEVVNDTRQAVYSIDFYLNEEYIVDTFDSCKEITLAGMPVLFNLCGDYGIHCSPSNLLKAMGAQSPFHLGFQFNPRAPYELFDLNRTKCSQSVTPGGPVCSCADCVASCPPFVLPVKEEPFCIVGLDGFVVLSVILFVLLVGIFETFFILKTRKPDGEGSDVLYDGITGDGTQKALKTIIFERIGLICARFPWTVIVLGSTLCFVCMTGVFSFDVITDPVKLWSAPDAVARIQRDYYNEHLGAFYRVQQVIILNEHKAFRNYSNSFTETTYNVSSVLDFDFLVQALDLQRQIMSLEADYNNSRITLQDICFSPLKSKCAIQSPLNWFQNDETVLLKNKDHYLDHIIDCIGNPALIPIQDETLGIGCLGDYGGPSFSYVALGGYENEATEAEALVLTFLAKNLGDDEKNSGAIAWEHKFVEFMKSYKNPNMSIAFSSESSINAELDRESKSDISTIVISYMLMFVYVSFALGRYKSSWTKLLLYSQITLGAMGVILVLVAVVSSIGLYSLIGVPSTLIIFEVIPFLVLAVGVDNIFILVQTHQRTERLQDETVEQHIARVLGKVGPSMLMASASEITCFFLGATTTMPAVQIFALYAGMALLFDFLLQITVFVAFLSLDSKRQEKRRFDILCCFGVADDNAPFEDSYLFEFMKHEFSPVLRKASYRNAVMILFFAWLCLSAAVIHKVDVGLDQEISMPHDSYLQKYFNYIKTYLNVGPPVYFVVKKGYNYTESANQDLLGSFPDAFNKSLVNDVKQASRSPKQSIISAPALSWIDDYFSWTVSCCKEDLDRNRCFTGAKCRQCPTKNNRPDKGFAFHIREFLDEIPDSDCPKAGHAAFSNAMEVDGYRENATIGATSFMTYHSVLRTSADFTEALKLGRYIADSIERNIKTKYVGDQDQVSVYPYSIFYVFYEQYLTIWRDVFIRLLLSFGGVAIISFIFMNFSPVPTLAICLTIAMIVVDMMGIMYFANISLNAISLVNLVMCVGISVEFCSHIVKAFAEGSEACPIERSITALAETGSSVLSGITCTKFAGVAVLAFASSQLFVVFYFRMYLAIVLIGSIHGLIFLPVFLAIFGGSRLPLNRTDTANHRE